MLKSTLLLTLATAGFSTAATTIQFNFGSLRDEFGVPITDGSTIAIFADNGGDGFFSSSSFAGETLTIGSFYDGNELIALDGSVTSGPTAGIFDETLVGFDNTGSGVPSGTQLMIVWFPDYTDLGTAIEAGQVYGTFTSLIADPNSGGNHNMTVPVDGNFSIFYFDQSVAGGSAQATVADFTADQVVAIFLRPHRSWSHCDTLPSPPIVLIAT